MQQVLLVRQVRQVQLVRVGFEASNAEPDEPVEPVEPDHVTSLYPTLYRLEEKGLIEGRWVEKTGQRRRRKYRLTPGGRGVLAKQRLVWEAFYAALARVAGMRR